MGFKVLEYSDNNLKECFIAAQADAHDHIIDDKEHLRCLRNYFTNIQTKTIVVEGDYVNREFLEDYSSYYVRSFTQYRRSCVRLHFFGLSFNSKDFTKILEGQDEGITCKNLQDNYQGYMVLKPLPSTIIGKTCLITYPSEGRRYFPAIRKYEANLYGIALKVQSLAYQEQDSIVSACASSSIWTAFHGTGMMFQHQLPSPVEITNWATKYFPFANRHFPNKGLSAEQMAIAIREVGLEPYLYNVSSEDILRATVYAYLKGKIPVVLGFGLREKINDDPKFPSEFPEVKGKHAVTVTGYSMGGEEKNDFEGIKDLTLHASRINKLYVHDDQVGPFARMEVKGDRIEEFTNSGVMMHHALSTTWRNRDKADGKIFATPEILIIPLYHKIRIPFESVLVSIHLFNDILKTYVAQFPFILTLEWDIYLSTIRDFKSDILRSALPSDIKKRILTERFPKYLWRAIGLSNDERKIEFVLDATDIDQGSFFVKTIIYDETSEAMFKFLFSEMDVSREMDLTLKEMVESLK